MILPLELRTSGVPADAPVDDDAAARYRSDNPSIGDITDSLVSLRSERDAVVRSLILERDAVIRSFILERESIIRSLCAERDAMAAERDDVIRSLCAERDAMAAERDDVIRSLCAERDAAVQSLCTERDALMTERDRLGGELEAIYASTSWRLTEPFRQATSRLLGRPRPSTPQPRKSSPSERPVDGR